MTEQIEQDSTAWHKWRSRGLGSSEIPAIMAVSPWSTMQQIWEERLGLRERKPMNWAMVRGKDLEPVARDIYEWNNKIKMEPRLFEHPRWTWMRASMDGFNEELWKGIEIKVPGEKTVKMAMRNEVPDHYYAQMQWQMFVSGSKELDYVVLDQNCSELYVISVDADRKYQRRMVALAKYFWFHLCAKKELPMLSVVDKFNRVK